VKALDTGVLLSLLEGSARVRERIRALRGEEVATTEANLLELAYLAAGGPVRGRVSRLAALERLRQRVTVLPIDARSVREAASRVVRGADGLSPTVAAMLGALVAAGCDEILTDDPKSLGGDWGLKIRAIPV
jgi:predicted nucleic acid-binding protein